MGQDFIFKNKKGAARDAITKEQLDNLEIGLPPFGEQKRIVAKIESTQEKIKTIDSSVSRAKELTDKYRESLLQKAFRGELVKQDPKDEPVSKLIERIRARQSDRSKKNKFRLVEPEEFPFEIPNSWHWIRLGDLEDLQIINNIQDGNHGEMHPKAADYTKEGIHFVMANNIKNGFLDLDSCKKLPKKLTDRLRIGFAKSGDVLLSHKGTIGSTALVPEIEPYVMLTPQVTLYRVDGLHLLNKFLLFYFQSWTFQSSLRGISKQATRDYVGITRQKDFCIPLPPFKEQLKIVKEIEQRRESVDSVFERLSSITKLLKATSSGILNSAFSGRLVPQVQSEGTGHDLLKSILERTNSMKEKIPRSGRKKKSDSPKQRDFGTPPGLLNLLSAKKEGPIDFNLISEAGYHNDHESIELFYLDLKKLMLAKKIQITDLNDGKLKIGSKFKMRS